MNLAIVHAYISAGSQRRKFKDIFFCFLLRCAAVVALLPLFLILAYVSYRGISAMHWTFFTELPKPVGEAGGGMANALVGTLILIAIGSAVGVGWGLVIGIFLAEFSYRKSVPLVRMSTDILASVPSIIVGLFIYAVMVLPMRRFSALAGGLALGILMIPTVAKNTEELLKLVPDHIREAGLALGLPRWKVILRIILRGCAGGIATGVILAIARVAGETAPLLFTAFGNHYWHQGIDQPIASLPVQIYTYAISPFDEWQRQAWAGALVLVFLVFSINLITRTILGKRKAY